MSRRVARLDRHGRGVLADGTRVALALPGEAVDDTGKPVAGSPDRAVPPCPHFGACGGCALQHASDGFVAKWKVGTIARALKAQGVTPRFGRYHRSPPASRRRATLAAVRRGDGPMLGFHAARSHDIVEIVECLVLVPAIMARLDDLRGLAAALVPDHGELTLQVTETLGGLDVGVTGARALAPEGMEALIADHAGRGIARITLDGEPIARYAEPLVDFDGIRLVLPPAAFLQATRAGEAALRRAVLQALADVDGPVADLFSGCGTFALPMARGHAVHAVEADAAALDPLARAAAHTLGLKPVTTETRDLFRRPLLAAELNRFAAAVIDPPRAGAQAQVSEIAKSGLAKVVHVSCNPVTFAREARTLIDAGFDMEPVDVVDQFLWSTHVELVATFRRGG